jgi:tetratricopeptide (TPR) repeat protein
MKLRIALIVVAIVAGTVAAFFWNRASGVAAVVAEAIPEVPELSGAPSAFREHVLAADNRARSLWSARRGFIELSRLYHANGQFAEALQCYDGLLALEPDEPRWPHLKATIIAGYGRADEAEELWKRTVALAPDYLPARIRLGDIQLKANRIAEASANYNEILRRTPDQPYALLGLARIDLEADRLDDARRRLETVVSKTNYTLGYDLIVSLYERIGLGDRALAIRGMAKASGAYRDPSDPWHDELLAECYDPYRLALAAGTIARDGRVDEAVKLLRRALELAPDDVSTHFQLGTLSVERRDIATARYHLQRCTELAPHFADGWAHLSDLQLRQGERTASERTLAEGLRNCPQSPGLHLTRARRMKDAGRTGEAIVAFETSIRYRPNEADAYLELGSYLVTLGREAEAMRQFRRAIEAEPGNPMALGVLAFNAITTGDEAEARKWLELVHLQPRIDFARAEQLRTAYRQQFGRPPPAP